jgi:hypothetical protein
MDLLVEVKRPGKGPYFTAKAALAGGRADRLLEVETSPARPRSLRHQRQAHQKGALTPRAPIPSGMSNARNGLSGF